MWYSGAEEIHAVSLAHIGEPAGYPDIAAGAGDAKPPAGGSIAREPPADSRRRRPKWLPTPAPRGFGRNRYSRCGLMTIHMRVPDPVVPNVPAAVTARVPFALGLAAARGHDTIKRPVVDAQCTRYVRSWSRTAALNSDARPHAWRLVSGRADGRPGGRSPALFDWRAQGGGSARSVGSSWWRYRPS